MQNTTNKIIRHIEDTFSNFISAKKLLAKGITKDQIEAAYDEGVVYYNMFEFSPEGLEKQGYDVSKLLVLDNGQVVASVALR